MSLEPSHPNQDSGRAAPTDNVQYRLRYSWGDLELYSEWYPVLATVENLAVQLREHTNAHDIIVERRTEVRA